MTLLTLLGWLGTFLYLGNHAYLSLVPNCKMPRYYASNLLAAVCLIISSVFSTSWQAVMVNAFWAIVSLLLLKNGDISRLTFKPAYFYGAVVAMVIILLGYVWPFTDWLIAMLAWVATFLFCSCYLLFSAKRLAPRHYFLFNALASICLVPQMWLDQNWPVVALQIMWCLLSLVGAVNRYQQLGLLMGKAQDSQ